MRSPASNYRLYPRINHGCVRGKLDCCVQTIRDAVQVFVEKVGIGIDACGSLIATATGPAS